MVWVNVHRMPGHIPRKTIPWNLLLNLFSIGRWGQLLERKTCPHVLIQKCLILLASFQGMLTSSFCRWNVASKEWQPQFWCKWISAKLVFDLKKLFDESSFNDRRVISKWPRSSKVELAQQRLVAFPVAVLRPGQHQSTKPSPLPARKWPRAGARHGPVGVEQEHRLLRWRRPSPERPNPEEDRHRGHLEVRDIQEAEVSCNSLLLILNK